MGDLIKSDRIKELLEIASQSHRHHSLRAELRSPFDRFGIQFLQIHNTLLLAAQGVDRAASRATFLNEVDARLAQAGNAETTSSLMEALGSRTEQLRIAAEFAVSEQGTGYRTIHSQAIVALWTCLEACVQDAIVSWLLLHPDHLQLGPVQKAFKRISIRFQHVQHEQRIANLVDDLLRGNGPPFERFDKALSIFSLSFDVDESVKMTLHEMQSVRNAIVHRLGIANEWIVRDHLNLELHIGDSLSVSQIVYIAYKIAVEAYIKGLVVRMSQLEPDVIPITRN